MEFLGRVGPEASGRAVARSDEDGHDLLRRFARGQCTQKEREKACRLMHERPQLLRMVASEMKQGKVAPQRAAKAS